MQLLAMTADEARQARQARELVEGFPFLREAWPQAEPGEAAQALMEGLPREARVWALAGDEGWRWLAAYAPLAFDTLVFGQKMARLAPLVHHQAWPQEQALGQGRRLMTALLAGAQGEGFQGLMARAAARDFLAAQVLEAAGFRLYDVSVEWMLELDALPPAPPGAELVAPAQAQDHPALLELASRAFCQREAYADRFALDPRLRPGCAELYRRWMVNSLRGEQADQTLVLRQGGKARGFITLKKAPGGPAPQGGCGWVALNAVSPAQRGRGFYHALLWQGLAWLRAQGAARARVRTKISQQAVIRAWSRLGARQVYAEYTFHHWLEPGKEQA